MVCPVVEENFSSMDVVQTCKLSVSAVGGKDFKHVYEMG